jgi:hypothetical protein
MNRELILETARILLETARANHTQDCINLIINKYNAEPISNFFDMLTRDEIKLFLKIISEIYEYQMDPLRGAYKIDQNIQKILNKLTKYYLTHLSMLPNTIYKPVLFKSVSEAEKYFSSNALEGELIMFMPSTHQKQAIENRSPVTVWTSNKKAAEQLLQKPEYRFGKLLEIDKNKYISKLFFTITPLFRSRQIKKQFLFDAILCDTKSEPRRNINYIDEYWLDGVNFNDVKVIQEKGFK